MGRRRNRSQFRLPVFVAVGLSSLLCLGGTAMANRWAPAGSSDASAASVCFTNQDLDPVAAQQAELSAVTWNLASTALDVSFGQCPEGSNEVTLANSSLDRTVLGNARWSTSGDAIVSARVLFDPDQIAQFGRSTGLALAWRGVTCHEMGHALGLAGHSSEEGSCMQTGQSRPDQAPTAADMGMIRDLYGGSAKQGTIPSTVVENERTDTEDEQTNTSARSNVAPPTAAPPVTTGSYVPPRQTGSVTGRVIPYQPGGGTAADYPPAPLTGTTSATKGSVKPYMPPSSVTTAPATPTSTTPSTSSGFGTVTSGAGLVTPSRSSSGLTTNNLVAPVMGPGPMTPVAPGGCCGCGISGHCGGLRKATAIWR